MKYFSASLISIILHILVIGGILFYAFCHSCRSKKQPGEQTTVPSQIELGAAVPAKAPELAPKAPPKQPNSSDIAIPTPEPKVKPPKVEPKPEPKVEPKPEPKVEPKPEPKPEPKVEPKPKKPQPKPQPKPVTPVEKGPRVRKPVSPSSNPPPTPPTSPTMTEEELKEWLGDKVRINPGEQQPRAKNDPNPSIAIIKKTLYNAWNQPTREAAGIRPAEVVFSIGADGRIQNPRIQTSSGSEVFDQSVLAAFRGTGSIPGLPAEFLREYQNRDILIEFKLSN